MTNKTLVLAISLSIIGAFTQLTFTIENALLHILFTLVGLIFYFIVQKMDIFLLIKSSFILTFTGVLALLILLLFIEPIRGAARWFSFFGFSAQPSVLFAPFFILTLSYFLTTAPVDSFVKLLHYLVLVSVPLFLIFKEPDLGTTLILSLTFAVMLVYAGIKLRYLATLGLLTAPVLLFLPKILKPYQIQRLASFLNPQLDPSGINYNSLQAIVAIGSGGWFGKGFLQTTQSKLHFLPEAHTDFIFAASSEAFGFFGVLIILVAYFLLLYSLLPKPDKTNTILSLYSVGAFTFLFSQLAFNIGMNLRLLPVVGVPLPLISYGGSSLLSTYILLSIKEKLNS